MPAPAVWGHVCLMSFALFGLGHFAAVNANQYARACLSGWFRTVYLLAGMLAWALLLPVLSRSAERTWLRYGSLCLYITLTLHCIFCTVDGAHIVPMAVIVLGCVLGIRHDVCDTLIFALVGSALGVGVSVYNVFDPVHETTAVVQCETHLSVLSLLVAGALHVYPATLIYVFQETSDVVHSAFVFSLALHAAPVVTLNLASGSVWVPVMVEAGYTHMLVGGVSLHEAVTLVAQVCLLLSSVMGAFWLLLRTLLRSPGVTPKTVFAVEPYFLLAIATTLLATLLLAFDYSVLIWVHAGTLGCILLLHILL